MQRLRKLFPPFLTGATITTLILLSLTYLLFAVNFKDRVYPGVKVASLDLGRQTPTQVEKYFRTQSQAFNTTITISSPLATISATAKELNLHYDEKLIGKRAFSIGRQTKNPYYNLLQIFAASQGQINLPLEISLDREALNQKVDAIAPQIEKPPVDALFKFAPNLGPDQRGRVTAYKSSQNGLTIDRNQLVQDIISQTRTNYVPTAILISLPTKVIPPTIKTSTANDLGISDLLGEGASYFYDSIPTRVYNISLGTEKVNGSLIKPGEIFSFDQAIGTVSAVFGFRKAYVIKEGKTVLDDGGGVCQVSTTLYRAVLNAGLPVIERVAHTYRVGFYEQGGFLPGLDATVYPPSPDFRFKNDTGHYLLIQATIDYDHAKLVFDIFGTADGRQTTISGPNFLSTSPPPEPIFEDDPTLPVGQIKQVDTAHPGAKVYFKRTVTRGNDTLVSETVYSDFIPWPARFLRGTKT